MKKLTSILATIVVLLTLVGPTYGQSQQDPLDKMVGPYIDLHGNGNYFNATNRSATLGGGFGGKIGIGFTHFSLYTGLSIAGLNASSFSEKYENSNLTYLEWNLLGAQYHFRSDNPALIPYAEAALSITYFTPPDETEGLNFGFGGAGPTIGGGIKYFIGRTIALDLGLNLSYAFYGEADTIDKPTGTNLNSFNAQLNVGFSLYPLNTVF